MLFIFIERYLLGEIVHISVNTHSYVSALFCVREDLFVSSLLRTDNGRENHKALSSRKLHYPVNYRIGRLFTYLHAAHGTVRYAYPRVQKPEIIVYLGNRSHGRARVL